MEGWVKLSRGLIDKPIFQNEKLLKVWVWCLLKATHKQYEQLVGLQKVQLNPGQFIFGRKKAAAELNITESTVWRLIQFLSDKKNPSLEVVAHSKYSIITIVNWMNYQVKKTDSYEASSNNASEVVGEQQMNNKWISNEQQMDTNNKLKNAKNLKKNIYSDEFEMFWSEYPKKVGKDLALRCWNTQIKNKVSAVDLIASAKNYATACNLNKTAKQYIKQASTFLGPANHYKDCVQGYSELINDVIPQKRKITAREENDRAMQKVVDVLSESRNGTPSNRNVFSQLSFSNQHQD